MSSITDDDFLSVKIPNLENLIKFNESLKNHYESLNLIKNKIKSEINLINNSF
jgi:hypothetical protein